MSSADVKTASWIPRTEADLQAIRKQLARILDSTPFKTSKRYPALLTYVVEKALQGGTESLKERTLGIEVFRRNAQYDTNADPVVRIAAGEVRKRLAQYYYEPRHKDEIHIELAAGSYVPEFYAAPDARTNAAAVSDRIGEIATAGDRTISGRFPLEDGHSAVSTSRWRRILIPALCLILGVVAGVIGARVRTAVSSAPLTGIDEFWRPLIGAPGTVWLCVGEAYVTGVELNPNGARNRFDANYRLSSGEQRAYPALNLADSTVLARVAGLLQTRDKGYSVHGESETTFSDLTNGPAVLIGSFNNDWTIRLSDQLRFHFEMDRDAGEQWIVDRQRPSEKIGAHQISLATLDTTDAYAIISRVHDPSTGQMVVALAGISTDGTTAAGRFVSEPRYLAEFAKSAPRNWQNENLQIVIAAPIVDGSLGPPHVVSSYIW
ncbi:MAG: hypothetical protein ACRD40_17680 [Candidatus Acidiferrales bacterium]